VLGQTPPGLRLPHGPTCETSPTFGHFADGGVVTHDGEHFLVESAQLWGVSDRPVPIAVSMTGEKGVSRLADFADDS
jgi:hypothetical protein